VTFPTRLTEGQRLICCDQTTWRVLNADGSEAATGQLSGAFPSLAPGNNPARLDFQQKNASTLRVVVKTVKVYP
jgi:hypothetical protein